MELRGFDSYEVSLGDAMRGERASLGKSLQDVERDMRIKSRIIVSIEACDLSGFPNESVVAGYVRSYARYLGMDAEDSFRRFCGESGYRSPAMVREASVSAGVTHIGWNTAASVDPISRSRFALPASTPGFRPRVSMGALTSAVALVGLISALSYGGYALLQDIQRVGFAPLPEAPAVVADAPTIQVPSIDASPVMRPQAVDYQGGGVLTAVVMPTELPGSGLTRRDGPISAIDPTRAGVFELTQSGVGPVGTSPLALAEALGPSHPGLSPSDDGQVAATEVVAPTDLGIVLVASEDAWIRVREGRDKVLYEGVLVAGEQYDLPMRLVEPVLRAGNAGGIYIIVDGTTYGPVGGRGRVVGGVSLLASDLIASLPQADSAELRPGGATVPEQRADAAAISPNR